MTARAHIPAALASALVAVILLVKWTLGGSATYRAEAALRPVHSAQTANRAEMMQPFVALAASQAEHARSAGVADLQLRTMALSDDAVAFACLAPSAHTAYQRCGELVREALVSKLASGVIESPTLPAQTLPLGEWYELLVGAFLAAGLAAVLTLALARLLPEPGAAHVGRRSSWPGRVRFSTPPPPRVFTLSPGPNGQSPSLGARVLSNDGEWRETELPAVNGHTHENSARPDTSASGRELGTDMGEQLRALRDQLYVRATTGCVVVGVTSRQGARDAKSRIAAQLAELLANSQEIRVLMLEADFQQPMVDVVLNVAMPPFAGFSKQIYNRLSDQGREPWTVVRHGAWLRVLAEGSVRTPSMMYSSQFTSAVTELREQFDIIVADGPVMGSEVEVRAFDSITDAVLFVDLANNPDEAAEQAVRKRFPNKSLLLVLRA